jgi:ABC-type transporter Mla MlaB component
MSIELNATNDGLSIQGKLDRFNLSAKQIPHFPKVGDDVTIDMKDVSSSDTAGLAWLIKMVAFYQSKNKKVSIINQPKQLIALASISNVLELLPFQTLASETS